MAFDYAVEFLSTFCSRWLLSVDLSPFGVQVNALLCSLAMVVVFLADHNGLYIQRDSHRYAVDVGQIRLCVKRHCDLKKENSMEKRSIRSILLKSLEMDCIRIKNLKAHTEHSPSVVDSPCGWLNVIVAFVPCPYPATIGAKQNPLASMVADMTLKMWNSTLKLIQNSIFIPNAYIHGIH